MESTALLIKKKPVLPALASCHGLEKNAKKVSLSSSKRSFVLAGEGPRQVIYFYRGRLHLTWALGFTDQIPGPHWKEVLSPMRLPLLPIIHLHLQSTHFQC